MLHYLPEQLKQQTAGQWTADRGEVQVPTLLKSRLSAVSSAFLASNFFLNLNALPPEANAPLTQVAATTTLQATEVHFTLSRKPSSCRLPITVAPTLNNLVKDAALRLLHDDARFRRGVQRGIAAAERGEFVEHAEVWSNVEKILCS
ncbi:MAG: hypothetical protein ABSG65_23730 [Bryobacteraceae bacterium]